jgi:2-dehydro-3-deoxygalactonokinase
MNNSFFIGCDWGTSTFRLRLFNISKQKIEGEISNSDGVASTFGLWQAQGRKHLISKEQFFRQKLKIKVDALAGMLQINLDGIPIVISGMASSSIGMLELKYADLPYELDGSNATTVKILADDDLTNDIILISGVKTSNDVMRGEETQLIGLMSLLEQGKILPGKAVLIFPGTHSKHIYIDEKRMNDFQTFMTGEMYGLLSQHSILADSVDNKKTEMLTEEDMNIFKKGIHASSNSSLLHNIFSVRTNQLFGVVDKHQNGIYLSGLLIGAELRSMLSQENLPIILCSNNILHDYYKVGLEELGLIHRTTILTSKLIDNAAITGQLLLLHKTHHQVK